MISFILQLLLFPFYLTYYILESLYLKIFPTPDKDVRGKICLITGAGSGIGQKMCVEFAKKGCKIVGVDISPAGLLTTEELMKSKGFSSSWHCYKCDISKRSNVYETSNQIKSEVGDVDILVNNAGIVTGGDFLDCKDEDILKTMDVNCNAHFWTIKAFLPKMMEKNSGHIVSISSAAGLFGMPRLIDYCASKFAAVGIAEALSAELRQRNKTGVKVTTVCPYYISTGMFKGVVSSIIPIIEPEDAVAEIVYGVLKNKEIIIMPFITVLSYAFRGLFPVKVINYMGNLFDVFSTMEKFKGRK